MSESNVAAEGFFGIFKRERVNWRQYRTQAEASADIFEYIEHRYNIRKRRQLRMRYQGEEFLTHLSVETG